MIRVVGGMACSFLGVLVLLGAAPAFSTTVSQREVATPAGPVTTTVYSYGHCDFICPAPAGWTADPDVPQPQALVFAADGSNTARMTIDFTVVSIAQPGFEPRQVPALTDALTAHRAFVIENAAYSTNDQTTAWLAWGLLATNAVAIKGKTIVQAVAEYHSYHVKGGYLIHIALTAPVEGIEEQVGAFNTVRGSFHALEP